MIRSPAARWLQLWPRAAFAEPSESPATVRGPAQRSALSAGVPARRLRRHQHADSVFQQFLLRGAPDASPSPVPTRSSSGALALDADWALAPALRDSMAFFISSARSLFVPFAGTPDLSRSHFETQDSIELGQPLGARATTARAFSARLHRSRRPSRSRGACHRLHRRAAAGLSWTRPHPEHFAAERRQAALR